MKSLMKLIEDGIFFKLCYGQDEYENKHVLDEGNIPLISAREGDNGCYGFVDVIPTITSPAITIARTGSVGEAFVQDVKCGITSDCLILRPKTDVTIDYLYYVASVIRRDKWRYNFGRKVTPKRLMKIILLEPDEYKPVMEYNTLKKNLYPKRNTGIIPKLSSNNKPLPIITLFNLERGQFHALNKLDAGKYPTVSRTTWDNGVEGFYDKPDDAIIYPEFTITVSTVNGDAFLQVAPFIATDNVIVLEPKRPLKLSTLLYIQAAINLVKWRYSYGRQCYKGTFQKTVIYLPLKSDSIPDEEYIESIVENESYWNEFLKRNTNGDNVIINRKTTLQRPIQKKLVSY